MSKVKSNKKEENLNKLKIYVNHHNLKILVNHK